ncbi:MAG: M10 family metallopeptidase [Hyphomicrobiales bacterium]
MPSTAFQGSTSTNVFVNALEWGGWHWTDGATPGTNITYYFQGSGVSLSSLTGGVTTSANWLAYEQDAYRHALDKWAEVANVTFTEVFSYNQADLVENIYNGSGNLLGVHETPEWAAAGDLTAWGAYNRNGFGWTPSGLEDGGFGFVTIVHELGHALGLAHPHDTGGGSSRFPGVTANNDTGSNDLNQGIFTVMSYIDGWPTEIGYSPSTQYGWSAGPMAFDIAAIQALYGANTSHNNGDTTYVLRHQAGDPDAFETIWDTGGTDSIVYGGRFAVNIDLRAATLENEPGGGGYVSYAKGAPSSHLDHWNAFTIANGAVIENAVGGRRSDWISGNDADNQLEGARGNDKLFGRDGNDTLIGHRGRDTLSGGPGDDIFDFNSVAHSRPSKPDYITDFEHGYDKVDLSSIDAKTGKAGNQTFKWIGKTKFHDKKGELHYKDLGSKVLVQGDVDGDGRADFALLIKVDTIDADDFNL